MRTRICKKTGLQHERGESHAAKEQALQKQSASLGASTAAIGSARDCCTTKTRPAEWRRGGRVGGAAADGRRPPPRWRAAAAPARATKAMREDSAGPSRPGRHAGVHRPGWCAAARGLHRLGAAARPPASRRDGCALLRELSSSRHRGHHRDHLLLLELDEPLQVRLVEGSESRPCRWSSRSWRWRRCWRRMSVASWCA
jgi:hypothetical protein